MLKKLSSTLLALSIFTSPAVMGNQVMAESKSPMKVTTIQQSPIGEKKVVFPYKVTAGDQIAYLAKRYNTTPFAIKSLNNLKTDALTGGQVINIPMNPSVFKEIQKKARKSAQVTATVNAAPKSGNISSGGKVVKVFNKMKATAYGNNHGWGNKTAMGGPCHKGVVAVDKNVIPLGSKVRITGLKSPHLPVVFEAVAKDTGVKGNSIDIYLPFSEQSSAVSGFGIQYVKVEIIG